MNTPIIIRTFVSLIGGGIALWIGKSFGVEAEIALIGAWLWGFNLK